MNQPSAPTAPAAPASPTQTSGNGVASESTSYESTFNQRSAEVFGNQPVDIPTPAKAADEADATAATPPAPSPAASADEDSAAKARRERIAALQASEAAKVDAKQRDRTHAELQHRLAAAERDRDDARRMAEQRIDVSSLTEADFFKHAANAKVTPKRLAEWLKEQTENPELAATRAAETAIQPKLTEWEKRIADKEARLDAILREQEQSRAAHQEAQVFREFAHFTETNATTSPRAAAFLREFGPEEFQKVATSVAANVPPNAGAQALLDHIEENFARLARVYAGGQPAAAKTSTPQPNHGAAKPMTTVSNTLAQQRASVVDGDTEWATLPFAERSRRLFGA